MNFFISFVSFSVFSSLLMQSIVGFLTRQAIVKNEANSMELSTLKQLDLSSRWGVLGLILWLVVTTILLVTILAEKISEAQQRKRTQKTIKTFKK